MRTSSNDLANNNRFKLESYIVLYFTPSSQSLLRVYIQISFPIPPPSLVYIYNIAPKATAAATPRPLAIAVGIAPFAEPAAAPVAAAPVPVAVAPALVAGIPGPPRDLQVPETMATTAASYEMEQMFKQLCKG
jgi:hypothetical protein